MSLTELTYYADQDAVENILSDFGVQARLDDDQSGAISAAEQARMTFYLAAATDTLNFFLWHKYTPAYLAISNWVNYRCALAAACLLCSRRGNPAPDSLVEAWNEAKEELEMIHNGSHFVPGLPLRMGTMPLWSNVRCDPRYNFRVIRVERRTSSQQPSRLPRVIDYANEYSIEL